MLHRLPQQGGTGGLIPATAGIRRHRPRLGAAVSGAVQASRTAKRERNGPSHSKKPERGAGLVARACQLIQLPDLRLAERR